MKDDECVVFSKKLVDQVINDSCVSFIKDINGLFIAVSKPFLRFYNLTDEKQVIGKNDFQILGDTQSAQIFKNYDDEVFRTGKKVVDYLTTKNNDGTVDLTSVFTKFLVVDDNNKPFGIYAIATPVFHKKEILNDFNKNISILSSVDDKKLFFCEFDIELWKIVNAQFNNKIKRNFKGDNVSFNLDSMFEYFENNIPFDCPCRRLCENNCREQLMDKYYRGERQAEYEFQSKFNGDEIRWYRLNLILFTNLYNGRLSSILTITDINEEIKEKNELKTQAFVDGLTGINNHRATIQKIKEFLDGDGQKGIHALMMIDIDNFKTINDRFGHLFGDNVLKDFAATLKSVCRENDIAGRLGGDEFVIFLKNLISEEDALSFARRVIAVVQKDYIKNGKTDLVTVSIGISIIDNSDKTLQEMRVEADRALYKVKNSGKNSVCAYSAVKKNGYTLLTNIKAISFIELFDSLNFPLFVLKQNQTNKETYEVLFVNKMGLYVNNTKKAIPLSEILPNINKENLNIITQGINDNVLIKKEARVYNFDNTIISASPFAESKSFKEGHIILNYIKIKK